MTKKGQNTMKEVKQAGYAYFSSDYAEMMGREDHGCYYVEIGDPWGKGDVYGPFDTVAEAESAAESSPLPWWDGYVEHPLNGSQFKTP